MMAVKWRGDRLAPLSIVAAIALPACKSEPKSGAAPAPAVEHAHAASAAPAELPPGTNPVQLEMRVLHEATRDWVTAVANNTLEAIPASIEKIHHARGVTEQALEKGEYKPPKNPDALEDFKRQDEAFHGELAKLRQASQAKDLPGTTRQLGAVLDGCTSCHTKYRF